MIASVTRLPIITGRKLVVLVDPATNTYQIDWERSALVSGVVPAQFTLDEDNRTYDLSGQAGPLMEIMQILKANNIPMNGTIDIRSNPAVRQQVMDVVRRAAAARAGAAHGPRPARGSHHRHRRRPSACRNSRRCGPPAPFRRPSTPPSASRSSPPCSRTASTRA